VWTGPHDQGYEEFNQAVDQLGQEFFNINPSPELLKHAREDEAFRKGLEVLRAYIEAQKKREGEDLTLGEARERQQEGSEQVRRIVEGDEWL
jgi:hypothetical protein